MPEKVTELLHALSGLVCKKRKPASQLFPSHVTSVPIISVHLFTTWRWECFQNLNEKYRQKSNFHVTWHFFFMKCFPFITDSECSVIRATSSAWCLISVFFRWEERQMMYKMTDTWLHLDFFVFYSTCEKKYPLWFPSSSHLWLWIPWNTVKEIRNQIRFSGSGVQKWDKFCTIERREKKLQL